MQDLIKEFKKREETARRLSTQNNLQLMTQKSQEARAETWEQAIALVKRHLKGDAHDNKT